MIINQVGDDFHDDDDLNQDDDATILWSSVQGGRGGRRSEGLSLPRGERCLS